MLLTQKAIVSPWLVTIRVVFFRSLWEIQDPAAIPGHGVSFFPNSSPRAAKRDLGGFKLNACWATWILLLDSHDLRALG